jgi:molybdopterin-synthase adenylyltransferase
VTFVESVHVREGILKACEEIPDAAGRRVRVLREAHANGIAAQEGCALLHVHQIALEAGILPLRYLRNIDTISVKEQLRLARSRVTVAGAGGLGGQVILLLARLGVGEIVVIDRDVFDETNLNRQALSGMSSMGASKARVAAEVVRSINPGVEIFARAVALEPDNAEELLTGSDVAVDALDNIPGRLLLEKAAGDLGIPMVHGALAGLEGQVMTVFPGDRGLNALYGDSNPEGDAVESPEALLGVLGPTAAVIATLQAVEAVKVLLEKGEVFRNTLVHVDLETGEMNKFAIC